MKKTSWLITILVCLLIIVGGAAVVLCPRIVFPFQCSEVYKRYSKVNGIDATFIKDYRVNDTVTVAVTMLTATTDSAWEVLLKDFNITPPPPEAIGLIDLDKPLTRLANRQDYTLPIDSVVCNNDVLSIVFSDRRIWIFSTEYEEQIKAINYHLFDKMIYDEE